MPIWQKRPFSKKQTVLILIFYQKYPHSLKNTVPSCHFFNFFIKTQLSCPHLVTKVWICQTTLDYGPKSQQDALFSDFIPKITAVIPMLCQKNVLSWQTNCPYVVKNVFFFKNTALSYHFFFIFHEKPATVRPIFGQKHENSVKTTQYYGPKKLIGCPMLSCAYFQKTSIL